MADIAEVMEYLRDKSVALVGNAQSIFDTAHGKAIDAHDVVIRFNRGFITAPDAQGSKTDILLLACELTAEELQRFGTKFTINRSSKTKCGDITLDDIYRRRYRKKYDAYPSTGMMAINLCKTAGAKSIDLYGFDFGKTQTYYNPADYVTRHDFATEEAIIKDWQKRGILTINENH
jgi:hypothetical protein